MLLERTCPLCHVASSEVFADSAINSARLDQYAYASRKLPEYMHHRLLLCRQCDLIYASPIPEVGELLIAYEQASFDSQDLAIRAAQTYSRLINDQLSRLPDQHSAIDIGTGEGAFLKELLNLGFENVCGVEPSRAPVDSASPEIRQRIKQTMFSRDLFAPKSATLVTCFQTIEHVADPRKLCEDAFEILVPGGMICIVGHNRRSFSARLLGRKSPIFDIEHLQLFSPESLKHLLEKNGFNEIRVSPIWNIYPLQYWTRLFPFPDGMKRVLLYILKYSGIGRLSIPLPAGNLIAFGRRPTDS